MYLHITVTNYFFHTRSNFTGCYTVNFSFHVSAAYHYEVFLAGPLKDSVPPTDFFVMQYANLKTLLFLLP